MGLIEQAKKDIAQITGNSNDFGVSITLTAPGGETCTLIGTHAKHHLGVDTEGNKVNTKNAHISISEDNIPAGYPVRDADGNANLLNHTVAVADSTGVLCEYMVSEQYPDETIGLIVLILKVKE